MVTPNIVIERTSDADWLTKQQWTFASYDGEMRLAGYLFMTRTTRRHSFRVMYLYNAYNKRDNNLILDAVPWDERLVQSVIGVLMERARATKVIKQFEREARVKTA